MRERLLRTEADLTSLLEVYERVLSAEAVPDNRLDPFLTQLQSDCVRLFGDGAYVEGPGGSRRNGDLAMTLFVGYAIGQWIARIL